MKEARHAIAGPIRIAGPKSSFAPVLTPVLRTQPKRVRAFIDLAVARLHEAPAFVLGRKELEAAAQSWRRAQRR
ncbi:MAG: hypothetical protein WD775_04590 [Burkholderiales bacterium]